MTAVAESQPSVRTIVANDVFRLSQMPDARYGVFAFTQLPHRAGVDTDWITYNFRLFFVDRLLPDDSNVIDAQSEGISVLDNVLRHLADVDGIQVSDYTLTPFTQRFSDLCAGVYAEVTITTLRGAGDCYEEYGE